MVVEELKLNEVKVEATVTVEEELPETDRDLEEVISIILFQSK